MPERPSRRRLNRTGLARTGARLAVVVVLVLLAGPGDASGQTLEAPDSTFRLEAVREGGIVTLSLLAAVFPPLLDESIPWRAPVVLDRTGVNGFDRVATRQWSPAAGLASDVLLYAGVASPFVASGIEALVHRHTVRKWAIQNVVVAESVLVAAGLTQLAKYSVRRARPLFFNPEAPDSARASTDANLSFWSGHTAMVASALTAFAVIQWQDEPGSGLAWAATAAAGLVVPAVAVLRVVAGKHYPSDVLVGGAVGIASGVLVPLLHRFRPTVGKRELGIDPIALPGGAGAAVSLTW